MFRIGPRDGNSRYDTSPMRGGDYSGGYDLACVGYATIAGKRLSDGFATARRETIDSVVGVEMATEPKNQGLTERHRQVLNVLANAPRGRDVNALLTLGFKLETMADLVRSGFATVRVETVKELGLEIEFACVRITDAGWRSLEGLTARRPSPRWPQKR